MNRYRDRDRWTGFTLETLVAVFLAALAAAVILALYQSYMRTAEEGILRAQLRAMRMQQKLFRVVHGRNPSGLRELIYDDYSLFPVGGEDREDVPISGILEPGAVLAVAVDESGNPVDPWGTPYEIDPATGRIYCATGNYENW